MLDCPPVRLSRAVRETLHWLVSEDDLAAPHDAEGESRRLLHRAAELHEALAGLPAATENCDKCLLVGSTGAEVPYLAGKLGWKDVTCVAPPTCRAKRRLRRARPHPNSDASFPFTLIEQDPETDALPLEDHSFGLVVYLGRIETLRDDPEFVFYELNRVVQPRGRLVLLAENPVSLQATHSILRGAPQSARIEHGPESAWRRYAPQEIEELLNGTGWRVESITSVVPGPALGGSWWRRRLFKRLVADLRAETGLAEPCLHTRLLVNAAKVSEPTRSYPRWLYDDEKIRQLKVEMLEHVSRTRRTAKTA